MEHVEYCEGTDFIQGPMTSSGFSVEEGEILNELSKQNLIDYKKRIAKE